MATLASLNVGLPKNVSWQDRAVCTLGRPRLIRRPDVVGTTPDLIFRYGAQLSCGREKTGRESR